MSSSQCPQLGWASWSVSFALVAEMSPRQADAAYGVPNIGVAGVGPGQPTSDALFPVRRQAGGIRTAAALHNLEAEAMGVNCRLMSGGVALEEVEIPLEANRQTSWFIEDTFTATDTSISWGRCAAPHPAGDGSPPSPWRWMPPAHLQHAFGGAGGPHGRRGRGDGPGFCAFRQRDLDHRSGVREPGDPAEPSPPPPPFIRPSFRAVPLFISTTPRARSWPPNRWWTSRAIWRSPRTAL